jgi:hypothetical protein
MNGSLRDHLFHPDDGKDRGSRARLELHQHRAAIEDANKFIETEWRRLAGDNVSKMLNSRSDAIDFLQSTCPQTRRVAFSVIGHKWKSGNDLSMYCLRAIEQDPVLSVRIAAISCLASCFQNSVNECVSGTLAKIVADEDEPPQLRNFAYCSLFMVQGISVSSQLRIDAARDKDILLTNIDWPFVGTFLTNSD